MIRQIFTFTLIVTFSLTSVFSQNIFKADPRLYECLDAATIEQAETQQPELIAYYNYYLDHSYYVVSLKSPKTIDGTDIFSVTLRNGSERFSENKFSKQEFNPLKYNFNLSYNNFTTYIWKKEGIAIIFLPLSHISDNFKTYLKDHSTN
jgi:hypothetical protein